MAWQENALLQRIALGYLAGSAAVEDIVADAVVDWRTKERVRVFVDNVLAAAAPSNNPLLNPASLKRAIDTAGTSWIRGLRSFAGDMASRPRIPRAVDGSGYRLGENIAATPGKVIRRGRLYELIQYAPMSESVDAVPMLCLASPVNKYYLLDLGQKESVTRVLLERGRRPFTVSWGNPDESHQDVGLDDYVAAVVEILGPLPGVRHRSGSSVGILRWRPVGVHDRRLSRRDRAPGSARVAHRRDRRHRLRTWRDHRRDTRPAVGGPIDRHRRPAGYFDGRDTAEMFAWIRPNDGIWVNVVNNYLLGLPLTTFDLVYWATDQTNLALAFGTQLVDITLTNGWAKPGGVRILGESLTRARSLSTLTSWVHPRITSARGRTATAPGRCWWPEHIRAREGQACRSDRKAPGSSRASYRTSESTSTDAQVWQAEATDNTGTWWEHWERWIANRTPVTRTAPTVLGSPTHPPVDDAPGQYVRTTLT